MQLLIDSMLQKPINTVKGPSVKIEVTSNGRKYSCFANDWNAHWKIGDMIDVEVQEKPSTFTNQKGQLVNMTYYNIMPPKNGGQPAARTQVPTAFSDPSPKSDMFNIINTKLDRIIALLSDAEAIMNSPVDDTDPIPF